MQVRGLEGSSGLRVRGIEQSSARAQVVERSSAKGRGLYRTRRLGARRAESGTLQHAVITELPVLESHVASNYTAQL